MFCNVSRIPNTYRISRNYTSRKVLTFITKQQQKALICLTCFTLTDFWPNLGKFCHNMDRLL